ncbi:MAG: aminotransferase class I/II-fold pyridoxal phosphate-dependent enzyme [Actinomycetota bacterium]|nr:aminotransferase class I/II-fold pyridoxal phosphate-dependent enzyme [Actinomycetota bacterium]
MNHDRLRPESVVVASGRPPRTARAPLSTPIVLSAPFHHGPDDNYYLRQDSSDTIRAFEDAMSALEGGTALAFSSGMAAVTAVVEGRAAGTVAVVPRSGYAGSVALFDAQQRLGRMQVRPVDVADTAAVLAALPGADLLWLESVTNPMLGVVDLPTLIAAARGVGALTCVDSTFTSPMGVRPLEHGADVVMHSATKYLSGHSDLLMGVLVTRDPELAADLRQRRDLTGAVPGALESYLALRGLRTLALRMQRAQSNALDLAVRLEAHPRVTRVRFPGLPADPGHELATQLHDGYGAMISFEVTGSADDAEAVCHRVTLISHATSLGGVESLIERRARHAVDAASGTPATLLRFSVGIEHVEDLWADLDQALSDPR